MQRLLKGPILAAVCIALVGGGGLWWWRVRNEARISFRTAVVKRGDLAATISATGTIEPVEVVDVGAQVAGLISSFGKDVNGKTVDYGSVVEEGGVLAKIDDSVYAADLSVARAQVEQDKAGELSAVANLEQMKARLTQTEAEWKRAQELNRSGLLALSLFDSNRADYEVARANASVAEAAIAQAKATTVQAQAALEKAQRNLAFCTIASPVKGVIIDRRVNVGQTVVASLNAPSLFLIAEDLTKMQIWVSVNEADVGRIVPGGPVTFTCDAFAGREFQGTVGKVRLNATMTQNVVMYTVEVNTENADNTLLPYLTANVHFIVKKEDNTLLVPNAALRWVPSSPTEVVPDARKAIGEIDLAQNDPPGDPKPANKDKTAKDRHGTVWLRDGEFVRPLDVRIGASDGSNTAVAAEGLQEGQEVVMGEIAAAQASTKNPFVPQIQQRR
ncbi:MAG TPA: efflux RND transporter periplasmic adaptor subunit [Verrucomicrobiae bacterium]|nr:efflux RND transporter periplasmic adaptor subunit [Verrucomicrobiae bacterium]